ncbi:hypothetical protein HDU97_004966 [Phlyctochytrium planicorne]|nr:hypothetical protein HDU97_004966 [Phlyctochytrium planicorne]
MKFAILSSAIAFLASTVSAFPGKSGACTSDIAAKLQSIGGMSPMAAGDLGTFKVTMDKTSYAPGDKITLNMEGPNFRGFLMYFSPASDAKKRVGKFEAPTGFQGLGDDCKAKGFAADDNLSVLTHTAVTSPYQGKQTFTYTAPSGEASDLNLNIVVLQKDATKGFTNYIYKDVAVLKGSGGGGNTSPKNEGPMMDKNGCPMGSTTTCWWTKTVQATKTEFKTVMVTATTVQTQRRKCTMKAMATPGMSNSVNGPVNQVPQGQPASLYTGKYFTMTCPQNVPGANTDTPALCTQAPAAPAAAGLKGAKKGSKLSGLYNAALLSGN